MGFFDNMNNWQEREEYATGVRAEAGPGYNVGIDDPIVKAVVTAGESGAVVNMVRELPDGKYMISMDVGGTAVANKDVITFSDGSATCGEYTLSYSDYALTITTVEEDTVVHIIMWKVAVNITNEFRAAIKDVVGDIGGGSSGGGALIVNLDSSTGALDKTWKEIYDAITGGTVAYIVSAGEGDAVIDYINYLGHNGLTGKSYLTTLSNYTYSCDTDNDYPVDEDMSGNDSPSPFHG